MRNSNDIYVGDLHQDVDNGRYYVELGHTGFKVFLDRKQLDNLGVPTGLITQNWCGWMGSVYTTPITGENYFIAE